MNTFFTLMSSLNVFLLCCWGALIIHLWFYSDFFAYYVRSFRFLLSQKIYKVLLIDDYFNNKDPDMIFDSYIEYVFVKYSFTEDFKTKFFLKLFSCITCFTVWISIIICLITQDFLQLGFVFLILRSIDFILRFILKKRI
jgi:hypothetical protein